MSKILFIFCWIALLWLNYIIGINIGINLRISDKVILEMF